ncbi:nitrite/sulfite reductase [Mycobacterium sp. DL440]|uniref:nitrite/sulfite reductase n=1 Tax=Mycobacterium sp. DL440 TaxID=2675523 RepID=UPI00141F46F1|nr:nitrite/sulfite reductase [Mycobacterium sp. DL440]
MTTPEAPAKADRPAKKPRDEGQWALGSRDPLNHNEQFKQEDDALNVRDRILNVYSRDGFASIAKDDLRGRFRWMGLYTQRTEGYDGTFTGDDNADLLEAEYFMMRVRTDGKAMSAQAVRTLGQISIDFARESADITDRENLQYHWLRIEDIPEVWRRLDEVGLQTMEACGDCPRGMLGSPLAGDSLVEVLDPTPALKEIEERYIGSPEFSNLPRKFKTAVSGLQDVAHEINDVSFIGVNHPEHGPGLDLWVGGGLSTNPMLAQRVGVWVPLEEVAEVWAGVIGIFRDYGYRRLRSKARLKFLVKDWGVEKFRKILEEEYLKRPLHDGPAPEQVPHTVDHVGVQKIRNGLNAVGVSAIAGRVSGTILTKVADLMEAAGSDRARLTAYQKLIILDVPDENLAKLREGLDALGLQSQPSHWRQNLMACTGIEYCKLSFADTRGRAQTLVPELEARLGDLNAELDVPVTVNINGCPNSCARIQVADIGFKGQMVDDGDGPEEGFQVHLGGSLGLDSGFGRKLRQHKVLATELGDYIERIVRNFVKQRDAGERFAQWAIRADEDDLR